MEYSKIINPTVAVALEAWPKGDRVTFLSYFAVDPKMSDNGNPRHFTVL